MSVLKIIRNELQKIIDNIDAGNSNITEEDALPLIDTLKAFTNKNEPMSKYQAFNYLHISRATFDNLVRDGKLPKGYKQPGFTELCWFKKDLDKYLKSKK